MDEYQDDIGHGALTDLQWQAIDGVSKFLRAPRQVKESLAADHKPTLDLVPMSVSLLLKHCDEHTLTMVGMKAKLKMYENKLVQEPAIIVAYLNPQIPKLTDLVEVTRVVDLVCKSLQHRYSAKISSRQSIKP